MKQRIILIIGSILITISAYSQIGNSVFEYAEMQYSKGNYINALKEYNRALFLGTSFKTESFLNIANCYIKTNDFELANKFYDKAYFSTDNDSSKVNILLQKSYNYILRKEFENAQYELYNIDSLHNKNQRFSYNLYMGIVYFQFNDFKSAKYYFSSNIDPYNKSELDNTFKELDIFIKKKSVKKYKILSYIIPGLGQASLGQYKDGMNSFVLNSSLLYLMTRIAIKYSYLDGVLMIGPWFQRYYIGGVSKAQFYAEKRIQNKKNETFNKILEIEFQ